MEMNGNDNDDILYDFEMEKEIDMETFDNIIKEGKNSLKNMNKNLKNYIYKKILNN